MPDHDLLARTLTQALQSHVGKPIFPDNKSSAKCHKPRAFVHYQGIHIQLHPDQEPEGMTFAEALRYLKWLIEGNFGHHYYVENAYLLNMEKKDV